MLAKLIVLITVISLSRCKNDEASVFPIQMQDEVYGSLEIKAAALMCTVQQEMQKSQQGHI